MVTSPSTSMFLKRAGFGIGIAGVVLACSGDPPKTNDAACDGLTAAKLATGPRGACPDDLPSDTDCGGSLPSYQADIAPLVSSRCGACHAPSGIEASLPFAPYSKLYAQRRGALNQIFTCTMPPACAHGLEPEERAALLQWFVCGALDN